MASQEVPSGRDGLCHGPHKLLKTRGVRAHLMHLRIIWPDLWGKKILNSGLPAVAPAELVERHCILPLSRLQFPGFVPRERGAYHRRNVPSILQQVLSSSPIFAVEKPPVLASGASAPSVVHDHLYVVVYLS